MRFWAIVAYSLLIFCELLVKLLFDYYRKSRLSGDLIVVDVVMFFQAREEQTLDLWDCHLIGEELMVFLSSSESAFGGYWSSIGVSDCSRQNNYDSVVLEVTKCCILW